MYHWQKIMTHISQRVLKNLVNFVWSVKRNSHTKEFGRPSISLESTFTKVYPDDCNFCHIIRIKHKEQIVLLRKIINFNSTKTIKESAKIKGSSLYAEILDFDLIEKEFKYYQLCYQNFTRDTFQVIN